MPTAVDEQQHERIRDDLKGVVKGEFLFDDLSRSLYSTDASIFQVLPVGVAVPRDEEDVQAIVRYAAEHRIPLVPRGAGTGCAGESLGAGQALVGDGGKAVLIGGRRRLTIKLLRSHVAKAYRRL